MIIYGKKGVLFSFLICIEDTKIMGYCLFYHGYNTVTCKCYSHSWREDCALSRVRTSLKSVGNAKSEWQKQSFLCLLVLWHAPHSWYRTIPSYSCLKTLSLLPGIRAHLISCLVMCLIAILCFAFIFCFLFIVIWWLLFWFIIFILCATWSHCVWVGLYYIVHVLDKCRTKS